MGKEETILLIVVAFVVLIALAIAVAVNSFGSLLIQAGAPASAVGNVTAILFVAVMLAGLYKVGQWTLA